MERTYMTPLMEQNEMEELLPLCNSGIDASGGDVDVGYGGVDFDGLLDPESKMRPDLGEELNIIFW